MKFTMSCRFSRVLRSFFSRHAAYSNIRFQKMQLRQVVTFKNTILTYLEQSPDYQAIAGVGQSGSLNNLLCVLKNPKTKTKLTAELVQNLSQPLAHITNGKQLVFLSFLLSSDRVNPNIDALRLIYNKLKSTPELLLELDAMETAILCNSFFVSNLTVTAKPLLRRIDEVATGKIHSSGISSEVLPLLKVLRKANFRTDNLMEAVADALSADSCVNYNLALITHSLAILADGKYHNPDRVEKIGANSLRILEEKQMLNRPATRPKFIHPEEGARAKDLTRLLWALSCLKLKPELFSQIAASVTWEVSQRLENGEMKSNPHLISDFLLSLACWKIYPEDFIQKFCTEELVAQVYSQNQSIRESRFGLFVTSAQIEMNPKDLPGVLRGFQKLSVEPEGNMEKYVKKRPILGQVLMVLQSKAKQEGFLNISCCCPIPYLNICGITFEKINQKYAVEVLDSSVCMRHTNIPDRLLNLKVRLLEQLGYRVIQIGSSGLKGANSDLVEERLIQGLAGTTC